MNDKQLCDRLVELGMIWFDSWDEVWMLAKYPSKKSSEDRLIATRPEVIANDWRVAGACLERMQEQGSVKYLGRDTSDTSLCTFHAGWGPRKEIHHAVNEAMPRAIIEAYIADHDDQGGKEET